VEGAGVPESHLANASKGIPRSREQRPSNGANCLGLGPARRIGAPRSPETVWSNGRVQTRVEELADNRIRLTVDVPGHDIKHAVEHAASDLAGSLKIPGFRKGKVPMPVLLSRVGRDRLYTEAVESHIGGWFWNAAARERLRPVAQPQYDFELPASDRDDWRFSATVEVVPKPDVADWTRLEVPRADVEVPEDLIEAELEALRGSVAELVPVEGRAVEAADTVVLDLVSDAGGTQRDYVVELGSGRLTPEVEQGIVGMAAGESRTIEFDRGEGQERGRVEVTVREIKEKVLPPLDDELARSASEFETLAELRSELESRLREQLEEQAEAEFRAAAADKLVEASRVEAAGPLVEARTRELLNGLVRSIERRGVSFETYLQLTGGSAEELVERVRGQAARSVARELVLEAAADRLGIEISDAEVDEVVRAQAEAAEDDPERVLERLRADGAYENLREDLRLQRALDRVAEEVKPIPVALAEARERLWTPEQERTASDTKLWVPGSKEPA
jgi:trigger factor